MPQTEAPPPIAFPGLTSSEVAERTADGRTNHTDDRSSRTVGDIVRSNVLTRFNAMVAVLAGTVLLLGDWRDALFALVAVANAAIGIVQEWRAKATLDRLSLVSAPKVVVWRNGAPSEISREDVVLDDVFELAPGDQVVVDGTVLRSDGLTVDESLLTGESEAVHKPVDVGVLSGSFVTAGGGVVRATAVGDDSYAQRLTRQAKQFRPRKSELARGIDQILRVVTWAIVPTAVILFVGQLLSTDSTIREDVIGSVAGVVALVPQGLVLLLSMAQAVAVIRLGRKNVLVQQLQAVETLARVTVLATDKTGTLTTGEVTLAEVELLDGEGLERTLATDALAALAAADTHPNATMIAVAAAVARPTGLDSAGRHPLRLLPQVQRRRLRCGGHVVRRGTGAAAPRGPPQQGSGQRTGERRPPGPSPCARRVAATRRGPAGRPRAGRARHLLRRRAQRRCRDDRLLPARERRPQGDLGRQPGHGVRDRPTLPGPPRRSSCRRSRAPHRP